MLTYPFFSKILKTTSALSLSAILLGSTFVNPSWSMEIEEQQSNFSKNPLPINELKTFEELTSSSLPIPPLQKGALLLLNVGHTLVKSCEWVSKRNTTEPLFEKHEAFMNAIKQTNETDYTALTKKHKLASGTEFVKVGEKNLPAYIEQINALGVNMIPITSRGGQGDCAEPSALKRTQEEFTTLNYQWKTWNKPLSLQNLKEPVTLQDDQPDTHGIYEMRDGIIIYKIGGTVPRNAAAIVGLMDIFKSKGEIPPAIYVASRDTSIKNLAEDLKDHDFGIPIYLLRYAQHQAFSTPEDLKEFYIHRLGLENFQNYNALFEETFLSVK